MVFLENELLYGVTFDVDSKVLESEFVLPIGKCKVQRVGKDITLVAHSIGVHFAMAAADQLAKEGISCEVINLRSIRPLDMDTINESIKKTHHVVTVEGMNIGPDYISSHSKCLFILGGFPQHGVGAEVAARLMEGPAFHYLDAPVIRCTGADVPMPYSKPLEFNCTPQADTVVKAVKRVLNRQ